MPQLKLLSVSLAGPRESGKFFSVNYGTIMVPLWYHLRILAMKTKDRSFRKLAMLNRKLAKSRWGPSLTDDHLSMLAELSRQFQFSVAMGDLILLDGSWYVTHTGLIRLARKNRCAGIQVRPVLDFSDASCQRWAFEATVYKSRRLSGLCRLRRCRSL